MFDLKTVMFRFTKNGKPFSLSIPEDSAQAAGVTLKVEQEDDLLRISVHTEEEIILQTLTAVCGYEYNESDRIFLNGYQSWTDSTEHGVHDKMRGIDHIPEQLKEKYAFAQYGDYGFTPYANRNGALHGWSYGYIRDSINYFFFGSLNEQTGFTCISTDTGSELISFRKDCEGLRLCGDYSMEIFFAAGTEKEVFDSYFAMLDIQPTTAKPLFGYTSWYRHYQDINAEKIRTDLSGLAAQQYPADVFQIDDGWQTAVGDWLSVDQEKFPDGMQKMAEEIRAEGYLPGLWFAPFACEEKSDICKLHADWLLKDADGNYVKGGSNWGGFYALDFYNEEVQAYLRRVFDTVVREWGYGLLKLDFLYAACIVPRPDKTRGQVMAEAMDFLRECAGDAMILGCGVPLASAFGKVDYCRIGCDVALDWDDKPHMRLLHRERPSTKHSLLNTAFRRQLDGRAFRNDPDVFILRTDGNSMTTPQRQCLAEVNALMGSVLFTSDNCAEYNLNQQQMLTRLMKMRNAEVVAAELNAGILHVTFRLGEKELIRSYTL